MTIEELQNIKLDKIESKGLQKAVKDMLSDFEDTTNKKAFKAIAKDNIEKVFLLVERMSPNALKKEEKTVKKKVSKKVLETTKKVASPKIEKELDDLNESIKVCRSKIRAHNKEKRKNTPKKPKPTRHTKIKKHLLAIVTLIPPEHKDDMDVQKEAEKVLLRAHRGIMNAYQMNTIRAKEGEKAIKEKYNQIEEQTKK